MSPLMLYPELHVVVEPRYFGSVAYYATLAAFGKATVDVASRYDKRRKSVRRCDIVDTHGETSLTVPIKKPESLTAATWADIEVSDHGNWWHVHRTAIESAYGRTPFFEFYKDDLFPYLTADAAGRKLVDLCRDTDKAVRTLLGIMTEVEYGVADGDFVDCRREEPNFVGVEEYYQIWSERYGFKANQSILDLLFNMGPEAVLVLRSMLKR